jgi:chemotaxis protein MotA
MHLTTIIGLLVGIGGILLGNALEGGHFSSLIQGTAALIVFGGTVGAVVVSAHKKDINLGLSLAKETFFKKNSKLDEDVLLEIIDCAKIARKESILSIEPKISKMKDPFLQNVIRTVVDGIDPQIIREIFEKKIELEEKRLNSAARIWTDAGGFAPTVGIIGAVLGLIHVMGNLTDTSKLGAGIAVAFVATIYGVGSANLIFLPIANKIKRNIVEKVNQMEMILEGGISILSGMSPSLIELKLRTYIEEKKSSST